MKTGGVSASGCLPSFRLQAQNEFDVDGLIEIGDLMAAELHRHRAPSSPPDAEMVRRARTAILKTDPTRQTLDEMAVIIGGEFAAIYREASSPQEWRTIDSAPKDGTQILVFVPFKVIPKTSKRGKQTIRPHMRVVRWATAEASPMLTPKKHTLELQEKHGGYWSGSQNGFHSTPGAPSHWKPLPEPPK